MAIFQVHTVDVQADGRRRYMHIETEQPTLDAFAAELRKGPLAVRELRARHVDGAMQITASRPVMLTAAYVVMAQAVTLPFVEAPGCEAA